MYIRRDTPLQSIFKFCESPNGLMAFVLPQCNLCLFDLTPAFVALNNDFTAVMKS